MSEKDYRQIFARNLQYYMAKQDIKQIDLVNHFNLAKSTVSSWYTGFKIPRMDKIEMLANFFGINKSDLLEEKGIISYNNDEEETTPIPLVGEAAAGSGAYAETDIIDYIETPASWVKGGEEHVYLKVKGDSMEPEMHTGDLALIRIQSSIDSGDYAVVIIDDENGVIKRVMYDSNWVELQSINTMYAPRRFEDADVQRVRVFGLVRKILRNYDSTSKSSDIKPNNAYKFNTASNTTDKGIELYRKLDTEDKTKIKTTMTKMLKAEKYSAKDKHIPFSNQSGQIAAYGHEVENTDK